MIVDSDWNNLAPVAGRLVKMGFGYSCMSIYDHDIGAMAEALEDWGKFGR